jgi:hypothetical protein
MANVAVDYRPFGLDVILAQDPFKRMMDAPIHTLSKSHCDSAVKRRKAAKMEYAQPTKLINQADWR